MKRIYLDYAATTPLSSRARDAMIPWLDAGNPSSLHANGRRAKDAIDLARETVCKALGCLFAEVLFTSGGTESANLAIIGAAIANEDKTRNRILLGAAEHHCVLHTVPLLQRLGYRIEYISVDPEARIDQTALSETLANDVFLVSTQHVNNELGTINDVPSVSKAVHRVGATLHVDAVQSFLKPDSWPMPGDGLWKVDDLTADLLTVSSHKVNGPKAVGAIYIRAGTKIKALVGGGGQEREVRGGTENVAGIVGFAAAVNEHLKLPQQVDPKVRKEFLNRLIAIGAVATVDRAPQLNCHAHVRFPGRSAETLLIALDRLGVSASSGAACSSGSIEPSHVLQASGYSNLESREGIRFTLSSETTREELNCAADAVAKALGQG